jgi:hypothetical protein
MEEEEEEEEESRCELLTLALDASAYSYLATPNFT